MDNANQSSRPSPHSIPRQPRNIHNNHISGEVRLEFPRTPSNLSSTSTKNVDVDIAWNKNELLKKTLKEYRIGTFNSVKSKVFQIYEDQKIIDALNLFADFRVSALPVIERGSERLVDVYWGLRKDMRIRIACIHGLQNVIRYLVPIANSTSSTSPLNDPTTNYQSPSNTPSTTEKDKAGQKRN